MDYEGPQTKFNIVVNALPKFTCLKKVYNASMSHKEQIEKAKHYLTGIIHMGCSNLNQIHQAYLDVNIF